MEPLLDLIITPPWWITGAVGTLAGAFVHVWERATQ